MVGLYPQFEYQQAQLEAEVENLSWKVERAEITDRGVKYDQYDGFSAASSDAKLILIVH